MANKLNPSKTTNDFNPGPGQYASDFTSVVKKNPGWRIGTSERGEEVRAEKKRNYPSSDTYNPNIYASKKKLASWSFGTGTRADFAKGNVNPGPNNYDVKPIKESPAYGIGLKLDNTSLIGTSVKKTAANPGSSTYNPDYKPTKKNLPAFSMQGRHKNAAPSKVPGPGAYYSQSSPDKKAAPSYGFGTQQ